MIAKCITKKENQTKENYSQFLNLDTAKIGIFN